ncbi:MAG: class I SAM-dependent methyltransferase [Candidatus Woesearchaeota archaeon]|nr:class I SAM-dependent methyltransferase [Candidatus Woesearchaeota archaeon]
MNRIEVIQKLLNKINGKFYVEIGVDKGESFLPIQVDTKVGVDPQPKFNDPRVYIITSDDFFKSYPQKFPDQKIDVCFIDGMHTYAQALQDFNNAFEHLSEKGFIVMHDCSPPLAAAADPANTHYPEKGWMWCGDVWKAIVHLRSTRDDLHIFVLNTDYGIGVITRGKPENMLQFTAQEIQQMTYADLSNNRKEFLNLKNPDFFASFLQGIS